MSSEAPREFPSIDLYPLHDRNGFLAFALGLWFNTQDVAGRPTALEVTRTLKAEGFSEERIRKVLALMTRQRLLEPVTRFAYADAAVA